MKPSFKEFADQIVQEIKDEGSDWWNEFTDDQRLIFEERARRLVVLTGQKLTAIGDRVAVAKVDQDIAHVINTLMSELAITQLRAEQHVRQIISNVMTKATDFVLSVLDKVV